LPDRSRRETQCRIAILAFLKKNNNIIFSKSLIKRREGAALGEGGGGKGEGRGKEGGRECLTGGWGFPFSFPPSPPPPFFICLFFCQLTARRIERGGIIVSHKIGRLSELGWMQPVSVVVLG
jgi:hypothetical protein